MAKELSKNNDIRQFSVAKGWAHFLMETGVVFSVIRMDGASSYKDDMHLTAITAMASASPIVETDLPVGTVDAVGRVTAYSMSDRDSGAVKVVLAIKPDTLTLSARRTEGAASEVLDWPNALPEGTDFTMALSAPFVVEAANREVKFKIMRQVNGDKFADWPTFAGGRFLQVVKPLAV